MKQHIWIALLTLLFAVLHSHAKIMRNNALMTKMITHFQQDNNLSIEPRKQNERPANPGPKPENSPDNKKPERVLNLMQNVLCRNFPTIPCKIIMQDSALNKLIERSIQQLSHKKIRMDKTRPHPYSNYKSATVYPVINSEDLSNFLEVSHTGYFNENGKDKQKKKKRKLGREHKLKNHWSHEKPSKKKLKGNKDSKKATELYSGRKKMRKFYPHKIKYKDKSKSNHGNMRDNTEEKMSMSVELPEMTGGLPQRQAKGELTYIMEQPDTPVWRIDYMKHGVPSMNKFGFEDERLSGKLVKSGPNVVVDKNGLEQAVLRKDVLHPDVYIKKNYVRKNTATINSDAVD